MKKEVKVEAMVGNKLRVFGECTVTKNTYSVIVPFAGWKEWKQGKFIQEALPDLSDDDREFLMSGVTPAEWEQIYPKD